MKRSRTSTGTMGTRVAEMYIRRKCTYDKMIYHSSSIHDVGKKSHLLGKMGHPVREYAKL